MWPHLLFAAGTGSVHRLWFLIPLIVVVSLVYSASRYESPRRILSKALRLSLTVVGFMTAVLAVLVVLSYGK